MGIGKSFVLCKKCERSAWFSTTRKEGRSGRKDWGVGGAERTEWRGRKGKWKRRKGERKDKTQELSKITLDLHNFEKTAALKGFYIMAKMSDCWRV